MSAKGTRAVEVVRAAGVGVVVNQYEVPGPAGPRDRERRPSYGLDAAAALGLDPGRVFKTLVAAVDGRLVTGAVVAPIARTA